MVTKAVVQQVRTRKWNKRWVTIVGAALAASALLSAFQPAAAEVPPNESGAAGSYFQQGDFEIHVYGGEHYGLCATIRKVSTGESHGTCGYGLEVEVSDDLESAWGRGTLEWVSASTKGKGSKSQTSYKYGTLSVDATWTGYGLTSTSADPDPLCGDLFHGMWVCGPSARQYRAATVTGALTDSEWGTFVLDGGPGYMAQQLL